MSRKQAGKARPAAAAARKGRRPRHSPAAPAPRPAPGDSGGLAGQLRALGLKLREVPGDGNCLFRALGDQLEGHSRNHLRHRQETVQFMVRQRGDFEPFVEDDVPFDKHVANLAKPGTFAGNDAIVAFARNNQINVVIHQLNTPLWQIRGTDRSGARELHVAYRHGEHYDSVRRLSDDSEAPAYLRMEMLCKNDSNKAEEVKPQKGDSEEETEVEMEDAVQKVCSATGCSVLKSSRSPQAGSRTPAAGHCGKRTELAQESLEIRACIKVKQRTTRDKLDPRKRTEPAETQRWPRSKGRSSSGWRRRSGRRRGTGRRSWPPRGTVQTPGQRQTRPAMSPWSKPWQP
ncbi:OTU domain-containing protein 3 isoform X2 [Motacilla alba alba]|uniref:OTU domain-containing protein 3 isoform X2 n=1 Tax=Motacilla alba alba TaxID=1094192 RepID=UPI0018D51DDE|nr:OTU domain-containing protein 3 isoform X2 [Motacilla alba alba]